MAESICVGCGMCCDGTLFGRVDVTDADDLDHLRSVGVQLRARGSGTDFEQPCSCSVDGRCTVYDHRPTTCRTYSCLLLQMRVTGDITRSQALDVIARTKARRDEALPLMKLVVTDHRRAGFHLLHHELHQLGADHMDPVAFRREHAPLLLLTGGVHVQLVRWFYGMRTVSDAEPAAMGAGGAGCP